MGSEMCIRDSLGTSGQPRRLLVAFIGLFRHAEVGLRALEAKVILPNEANGTTTSIAVYTDPDTLCSRKEHAERRCACLSLPSDIGQMARKIYGPRLVKVHLFKADNYKARLADAWYGGGLRQLSSTYDAILALRPDVALTRRLLIHEACCLNGPLARLPCSVRRGRPLELPEQGSWSSYLACSAHAARVILSHDADDDPAPMIFDTLAGDGISVRLLHCTQ